MQSGGKSKRRRRHINRLWKSRDQKGYSQAMVAKLLGHQHAARISDYERGKRMPNLENAIRLAFILNTPLDALYPTLFREVQREIIDAKKKLHAELYGKNSTDK